MNFPKITWTVGVSALLMAWTSGVARAAYPGVNGKIAFNCYDGTYRICTINPDGTGETELTNGATVDEFPAWSADGKTIIFDRNGDIWTMNGDGSNQTQITTHLAGQYHMRGALSPDGLQIVFEDGNNGQIYRAAANGSNPVCLTCASGGGHTPFFSPDGSRILFYLDSNILIVMNTDGSNQTPLAPGGHGEWSPDGARIVFQAASDSIHVIDQDGTGESVVPNASGDLAAWSPDGTKILFRAASGQMYSIALDGSGLIQVVTSKADQGMDWGPVPLDYPGAVWTAPNRINSVGQIVGQYLDTSGVRHGYLLSGGTYTTIDCPAPYTAQSNATGINNLGVIVGWCAAPGGVNAAYGTSVSFRLSGGVSTFLPDVAGSYGGASTFAEAINDAGDLVGWFADGCLCASHGFLFTGGAYTTIDAPGAASSIVYGFNNPGQIVGATNNWTGVGAQGFLLSGGVYTLFDDPNPASSNSFGYDINDLGEIVGNSNPSDYSTVHGFLLRAGVFTTIDHPNALASSISGINALGQIVGSYIDLSNVVHAFLTTAVRSMSAPAITSATGATFTVGVNGSFMITSSGAPAPTITESGALPGGVTLVDHGNGTATLSGTPSTAGTYPLTFVAANGIGSDAIQNFTLTVSLPRVVGISLDLTTVAGGATNPTATVTLSGPAAGTVAQRHVTLTSDNTAAATVPAGVTVPIGATTATVVVTTHVVSSTATANISGTLNGGQATATLTVEPLPLVVAVDVNPAMVVGGAQNATGTVTLNAPAVGTTAQRRVTLSSDNMAAATVPATVTVAIGATMATFAITSQVVSSTGTASIAGTLNGGQGTGTLTVVPLPTVTSLDVSPASVVGGAQNAIGTVTLSAPAIGTAAQRRVTLASDNTAAATVPATVTVVAGATTATFSITSFNVSTTAIANVSATLNAGGTYATLTVNPLPGLTSLTLNPGNVVGGSADSIGTVTLSAPAAGTSTQRRVTLSSDNAAVATVPGSVVVPVGATSATFTVTSKVVSAAATVGITATINVSSASTTLTVNPLLVATVALDQSSVQGGVTNATGTVTLNAPAAGTVAQRRVALSSDTPTAASVPASVVVPVGATTMTFVAASHPVGATTTVSISATLNGGTSSTTLIIVP